MNSHLLTIIASDGKITRILVDSPNYNEVAEIQQQTKINWTITPFKIIITTFLGFDWYIRVTPTTFELLDSENEEIAQTGEIYFGAEVGQHDLGDPTQLDNDAIFQSKAWIEWYDYEAAPAMYDYATDKLN